MSTRILLVDDHAIMRQGLRRLLEQEPDMKVVAEAQDGQSGLNLARQHSPDVIVMDIGMPGMNGIEATGQILASTPSAKIIGLSMHTDRRFITGMLRAGASGYMPKDCTVDELVHGIRTVIANRMYLSPTITHTLVRNYISPEESNNIRLSSLTAKEREVLRLMALGRSTRETAAKLSISIKTVETHRRHITEKLNLHSVAELTKYAIREGIISVDE